MLEHERENADKKRLVVLKEQWARGTRQLPPLKVGDDVLVQNQYGPRSKAWEISGTIVEVLKNDSYQVKLAGSGRVSKRRRQFIRKIKVFDPDVLPGRG